MACGSSDVTPLKQRILRESTPLATTGSIPVYQIRLSESPDTYKYPFRVFEYGKAPVGVKHFEKVISIVGASGAGKTTLINVLINYIFGIEFGDNFRLKLVAEDAHRDQAQSQTQEVTAYTIHHQEGFRVPYTLTIIDTPGFGATEGVERDKQIAKQLQEFFTSDANIVDHIDAVGFVVPSPLARLGPTETYIFDSILLLFGQDISENIFMLLTFSDSQQPVVLSAIQAANIPHKTYFKFNNPDSLIFGGNSDGDEKQFNEMCWKNGMKSFQNFTSAIEDVPTKSLSLTKDVLEHRRIVEVYLDVMNRLVQESLVKLQRLAKEESLLDKYKADMEGSKSHTYDVEEPVDSTQQIRSLLPSLIWRGLAFFVSWYMKIPIPVPPIEYTGPTTVKKTITLADLKARYEEAHGRSMSVQQIIEVIREDLEAIQDQLMFALCEIHESLNTLRQIALKQSSLSIEDYINIQIQNEKMQARPGWDERVEELDRIREWSVHWMRITTDRFDPFKEFSDMFKQAANSGSGNPFEKGSPEYSDYQRARKAFMEKIVDDVPDIATLRLTHGKV